MRGTVTAFLTNGPYAGAYIQVEAIDGSPSSLLYFALVGDRVRPMPREDVDDEVLQAGYGRWHAYGRAGNEPAEDAWHYSWLPARDRPRAQSGAAAANGIGAPRPA